MNLLPLNQNKFAQDKLNQYIEWWKQYCDRFLGKIITVDGQDCSLLQREYAKECQLSKYCCKRESIPYIEITPLYREAKEGLLFVNCNPSGTDYSYYEGKNSMPPTDFFYYEKLKNKYFNEVEQFAKKVGGAGFENFAMIDVFPIVAQNQAVLKKAFYKEWSQKEAFDGLIKPFLDSIGRIAPKVVVVTNAFVKDLFTDVLFKSKLIEVKADDEKVCYHITVIQSGFKTTVFCGGMIAGGHQMDTESKKRLIRDVRHFINLV